MIRLLRNDGVRFPDNQTLKFATLDPLEGIFSTPTGVGKMTIQNASLQSYLVHNTDP